MFRQYLKTRVNDEIGFVPKCSFYQPSLFDEFLIDEGTRCSDITFVFSQQRLDKVISKENFDQYFNALFKDSSPNPYAGMSDDEIMDLVKDRRMTSFNDFYNYTRNLQRDASELEYYKKQVDERKKQQEAFESKLENLRNELGFSVNK